MFTLDQIAAAHARVKSGADFPQYLNDLKKLGIKSYENFVGNGQAVFSGFNHSELCSEAKYPAIPIAENSNTVKFKHYLQIHQQGQTDYLTFCHHAAESGVEKWIVDAEEMTCSYYDQAGNEMVKESIKAL